MKKLWFSLILIYYVCKMPALTSSPKPAVYSNHAAVELVSLNFQNIEVRSLLQLLADFAAYNILISDSVNGTMSLQLNDIPWNQALDIILNTKGLGMQLKGNVLHIATLGELDALAKRTQERSKVMEDFTTLSSITLRLKYAKADAVSAMLQAKNNLNSAEVVNSVLSSRGICLVDNRTNSIIINDTPSRLHQIQALIDKIDIPVRQVLISARIVEANNDFERNVGMRLLAAGLRQNYSFSNTVENSLGIQQQGLGALTGSLAVNQNFNSAGNASIAAIFAPYSDSLIGLEVDAEEAMNQGRTISNPKIMVSNYQTALIQQGVQIPYQQSSRSGNTNVAFVNATLQLQVTPQITADDFILLNIQVQKNAPSAKLKVHGTPAINTNSISTQVRVRDGSTILIGGIYVDAQVKVVQQVPLLGDIPFLGWLFKAQTMTVNKRELLVFITPKIITTR
jgi:type IV pilus assembly protein PilQ